MKKLWLVPFALLAAAFSVHAHPPQQLTNYAGLYIDATLEVASQACSARQPKTAAQWSTETQRWRDANRARLDRLAVIAAELENAAIKHVVASGSSESAEARFDRLLLIQTAKAWGGNSIYSALAMASDAQAANLCMTWLHGMKGSSWPAQELGKTLQSGERLLEDERVRAK